MLLTTWLLLLTWVPEQCLQRLLQCTWPRCPKTEYSTPSQRLSGDSALNLAMFNVQPGGPGSPLWVISNSLLSADHLNASWLHMALIGIARCGYLKRILGVYLKTQNYPISSKSMSSTNISHFLFFPVSAWGKNYHSSLSWLYPLTYRILGHIRPFCVLAPRLVREQENVVVTVMVGSHVLERTRSEVSRQFLDESSDSVKALQRIR